MDFAKRSSTPTSAGAPAPNRVTGSRKTNKKWVMVVRWSSAVMLLSVVVLIIALIGSIAFSKNSAQVKFVDSSKYQAVFLNGGQVYFGKIGALTDKYLTVSNIYYLRVNQAVQPNQSTTNSNDVSLVKLGCELHGPQDRMVINDSQIIFWENLKDDGQVAKAIAEYQKANHKGQDCSAAATTTTPAATTKKP